MVKIIIVVFAIIMTLAFAASSLLYEVKEVAVEVDGINKSIFVNSFDEWLVEQDRKDIYVLKIEDSRNFNSLKGENQNAWFSYKEESRTRELIDTFTVYQWFYWYSPEYIVDASGNNLMIPGEKVIVLYEESHQVGRTIINLSHDGENIISTITNAFMIIFIPIFVFICFMMGLSLWLSLEGS